MAMAALMKYNSNTCELVCYAPAGEEVLRLFEPDFEKANAISSAINKSFQKGSVLGRLGMQASIERHMDEFNK